MLATGAPPRVRRPAFATDARPSAKRQTSDTRIPRKATKRGMYLAGLDGAGLFRPKRATRVNPKRGVLSPHARRSGPDRPSGRDVMDEDGPRPKTRPNNIGLPERNTRNGRVTDSTGTMVFGCNLATRLARFGRLLAFFGVGAREIADTFRGLQVPPASQPGPRQCDRLGDSC